MNVIYIPVEEVVNFKDNECKSDPLLIQVLQSKGISCSYVCVDIDEEGVQEMMLQPDGNTTMDYDQELRVYVFMTDAQELTFNKRIKT